MDTFFKIYKMIKIFWLNMKKKNDISFVSISFICILSTVELWNLILILVIFKWKKGIYIKLLQKLIMIFEIR